MSDEFLKLHRIGFKGMMLLIEKDGTLLKDKSINGVNQNVCLQTQPPCIKHHDLFNGLKTPVEMLSSLKRPYCTVFRQHTQRKNFKEINRQIQGGRIPVKALPRAKLIQLNHYVTPTLKECSYDAAIIHISINNILRSKHYDELDKLSGNIIKVENNCQKYNIEKIYISNTSINKSKC